MNIEEATNELPNLITERGEAYAKSQSEYENLDKMREVMLSRIMSDLGGRSEAERRRKALASDEYEIHLTGLQVAREASLTAKALYEAAKLKADLIRSLNSKEVALSKIL